MNMYTHDTSSFTEENCIELFLKWGFAITYDESQGKTTQDEIHEAAAEGRKTRYVEDIAVDRYMSNRRLHDMLAECYWALKDPDLCILDFCEFQDWDWICCAAGIEIPYVAAKAIDRILFLLRDDRVISIDISHAARQKWIDEFCKSGSLGITSAMSFVFCPEGLDEKTAKSLYDVCSAFGVDMQKLTNLRIAASIPSMPKSLG